MAYLDETNDKPVQQKFLDLLALKPQFKEEVQSALHKIPELKLRPEKIPDEENVVQPHSLKNFKDFPYLDPVPGSMLHMDIRELSTVNIDWKMLTLDRPESQLEIQIFSRIVYLDKLMVKCMMEEKVKKEREKYIRLRTKGRLKLPTASDADKSDEFTYEYFSRFYGATDRAQAMEEVPKRAADDSKSRPQPQTDNQQVTKTSAVPPTRTSKRLRVKKKLKKRKRKKKCKKSKLRKRKAGTTMKPKVGQATRQFIPPMWKPKKSKSTGIARKKNAGSKKSSKKKPDSSSKTLVQMLKASELQNKKKVQSTKKSKD